MKNSGRTYLGVDLGGTKLLVGEMTEEGKLLRYKRYPSGPLSQRTAANLIEKSIADYLANGRPAGEPMPAAAGVGMVGRVDPRRGHWIEIEPGRAEEIPLGAELEERFQIPFFLDNDVRSAVKAEWLFGKGKDAEHFIYINIGTGIAAAAVSGNRLICGNHFDAGEVGHTGSGVALRVPCVCGRDDCVEMLASGIGLDTCARRLAPQYPDTQLRIPDDGQRVGAADIFANYDTDALCRTLTDNAAKGIANLIMNLARTFDPELMILGGGVMSDGFLYPKVMEQVEAGAVRFLKDKILLTSLDPAYIGLLGACSNAVIGVKDSGNYFRTEKVQERAG